MHISLKLMVIARRLNFSLTRGHLLPGHSLRCHSLCRHLPGAYSGGLQVRTKNKKPVTGGAFHGFACHRLVLRFFIGSNVVVTLVAAG